MAERDSKIGIGPKVGGIGISFLDFLFQITSGFLPRQTAQIGSFFYGYVRFGLYFQQTDIYSLLMT